jgi:ubiquinone/menaquinone biosynthesis C-methylase UbiE
MDSKNTAKDFFNTISGSYKHKYSEKDIFHYYFFTERLEKTTSGLELDNKKILDVGAGTGDLYDYICNKSNVAAYTATDVASGMLGNSNIPKERQMLGEVTSLALPLTDYDYVFMLGVTTYLTIDQMKSHLLYFKKVINENQGTLIITFTNSRGFDNFLEHYLSHC